MKIKKFGQILESNNLDKESILALIQDLSDTHDIEYTLVEGYFNKSYKDKPTSKDDQKCYKLTIDLKENGFDNYIVDGNQIYKSDDLIKILNNLSSISRFTETYLYFSGNKLNFIIISDEVIDMENDKIQEIYFKLMDKKKSTNTDFTRNSDIKKLKDSIVITIDHYYFSERKLNNFLNGIDLKDFKITYNKGIFVKIKIKAK